MKSSENTFKDGINKYYKEIELNADTMSDANKYLSAFKESMDDEDDDDDLGKKHISNRLAKNKFSDDLKSDRDYEEFKIRNKFKEGPVEYSFGTPHAVYNDPFVNKKTKKKETKEVKDLNLSKDNEDMVHGIVDLINQVKDEKNKKQIAQNMIKQFKRENIKVDTNEFLKMCNLNSEKKKKETKEASTTGTGGFVAPLGFKDSEFVRGSFAETPKLKESETEKVEATEATTGVGGYSTPAMWAKSTSKKDWGPSRKTQYPGGGFVKIKKKCTKFPYCNQGDINNLKISKNEAVKEAIDNVAKKFGLSKDVIMTILEHEYEITSKRIK